jgi:uncharacterized membrane protein YgcG
MNKPYTRFTNNMINVISYILRQMNGKNSMVVVLTIAAVMLVGGVVAIIPVSVSDVDARCIITNQGPSLHCFVKGGKAGDGGDGGDGGLNGDNNVNSGNGGDGGNGGNGGDANGGNE